MFIQHGQIRIGLKRQRAITSSRTKDGLLMIRSISISNFRCYKQLQVENCGRLNVIVGDNGTGKTSLLEAIFLALGGGTEIAVRLRTLRGLDASFSGSQRSIENAIFADFFYNNDTTNSVSVVLDGDGDDNRSLAIFRGAAEAFLPFSEGKALEVTSTSPFTFRWKDGQGIERSASPIARGGGLHLPDTGEDLPDFFFIPATGILGSVENAGRFSELSKNGQNLRFTKVFSHEYNWLDDLSIEVSAGSPAIFATLKGSGRKIPLANLSGGINRIIGILLTIASRPSSVVLVDEIESGIFYTHQAQIWRQLLAFARDYKSQLFVTTHSQECLTALIEAAGNSVEDIVLWRLGRDPMSQGVRQFWGRTFKAGIETGGEVR